MTRRFLLLLAALLSTSTAALGAQQRRDEAGHFPGRFNWQFLARYPEAARLFHAFDYGHAVLYERLLTEPPARVGAALAKEYRFLTTDLLRRPPRFGVPEEAIEPRYAAIAWEAKEMFDWAHLLHRQIYDLYADERLTPSRRDSLIEAVTDFYLARTHYAFPAVPKSMGLMDDQWFSQRFRKEHPDFNGLIWAYHWLQVGLYEPLAVLPPGTERRAGVAATVARFQAMVDGAPGRWPEVMPMTAAVAPVFSRAHPRAAIIFDNLHMMHDIISDILATPQIPAHRKGAAIRDQLALFRDPARQVISRADWEAMGEMMGGVARMGGAAVASPPGGGRGGGPPPR